MGAPCGGGCGAVVEIDGGGVCEGGGTVVVVARGRRIMGAQCGGDTVDLRKTCGGSEPKRAPSHHLHKMW